MVQLEIKKVDDIDEQKTTPTGNGINSLSAATKMKYAFVPSF